MLKQEIILEYTGHLTFSTTGRLLTMLKRKMSNLGIPLTVYKKILSVMIEVLENVYKYSEHYSNNPFILQNCIPSFKLLRNPSGYCLQCSNPLLNIHIPELRDKLEIVNSKTYEELRQLYHQTITNGKFSNKGGAGLGIIEMAKISGNPLNFSFKEINEEYSLYTLEILFNLV
ncbi:MAG: hypothetical protein IH594_08430 [Bacteroidales bacterium]|nr:hypothetical protein [Bacteroidales bacterium]